MDKTKRASIAIIAGMFCAAAGSLLAGVAVALVGVLQGKALNGRSGMEIAAFFATILLFAAIPAAPFGFIVGSVGGWWLASRLARSVLVGRVVLESAAAGALLGATFPLVAVLLGWGPFNNLISILPISIGVGTVCGVILPSVMRKFVVANKQLK